MTHTTITNPKETITAWMFGVFESASDRAGHAGLKKDYESISEYLLETADTNECANFSIETNLSNTDVTDTFACAEELCNESNNLLKKLSEVIVIPKYVYSFITDSIHSLEKVYSIMVKEDEADDLSETAIEAGMAIEVLFTTIGKMHDEYKGEVEFELIVQLTVDKGHYSIDDENEKVLANTVTTFKAKILETAEA